jgi:hypothetical protein
MTSQSYLHVCPCWDRALQHETSYIWRHVERKPIKSVRDMCNNVLVSCFYVWAWFLALWKSTSGSSHWKRFELIVFVSCVHGHARVRKVTSYFAPIRKALTCPVNLSWCMLSDIQWNVIDIFSGFVCFLAVLLCTFVALTFLFLLCAVVCSLLVEQCRNLCSFVISDWRLYFFPWSCLCNLSHIMYLGFF